MRTPHENGQDSRWPIRLNRFSKLPGNVFLPFLSFFLVLSPSPRTVSFSFPFSFPSSSSSAYAHTLLYDRPSVMQLVRRNLRSSRLETSPYRIRSHCVQDQTCIEPRERESLAARRSLDGSGRDSRATTASAKFRQTFNERHPLATIRHAPLGPLKLIVRGADKFSRGADNALRPDASSWIRHTHLGVSHGPWNFAGEISRSRERETLQLRR